MRNQRLEGSVMLVLGAAALLWLPQLSSSLWLDELDTYFAAKDGVWTAIVRTAYVHPQCSQLYNVLMALWVQHVGSTELLLRVPSILAMAVAAYLVYRLGRLLFDAEAGVLAALVFVTTRDVHFAAADARSYAFATAACVAATIALIHFLAPRSIFPLDAEADERTRRSRMLRCGAMYAVTAALTVYFHQLFGLVLLVHALVVLFALASGETRVGMIALLGAGVLATLLLAGEANNVMTTFVGRARIVHASEPSPLLLLGMWASPLFVVAVAPVAFLLYAGRRGSVTLPAAPNITWILLLAWAVVPPLVLFTVSKLSDTQVFLPRYYLSCQPALAILLGVILRGFEPYSARMLAAASVAAVAVVLYARPYHTMEDWRGTIAAANASVDENTLVLVDAGFIEAVDPAWLALPPNDDRRRFLLAPLSYYPLRGRVELLPAGLDDSTRPYLEEVIRPAVLSGDRFVCVGRGRVPRWWGVWLDGRFAGDGYVARSLHRGAIVEAVSYERRRDAIHMPPTIPTTNGNTK